LFHGWQGGVNSLTWPKTWLEPRKDSLAAKMGNDSKTHGGNERFEKLRLPSPVVDENLGGLDIEQLLRTIEEGETTL
jgi:hypothetical protein